MSPTSSKTEIQIIIAMSLKDVFHTGIQSGERSCVTHISSVLTLDRSISASRSRKSNRTLRPSLMNGISRRQIFVYSVLSVVLKKREASLMFNSLTSPRLGRSLSDIAAPPTWRHRPKQGVCRESIALSETCRTLICGTFQPLGL